MILIATQCFPPKLGGIESYMAGLAAALAAAGEKVAVFADGAGTDAPSGAYAARYFAGWRPLRRWRKAAAIADLIAQERPSRVFTDSWKSLETVLAAGAPKEGRPRLVTLAHGMEFPAAPSAAKRARIRRTLSAADAILANSAFTAARARAYLAVDAPLHVETPPIPPQPEPDEATRAALCARLDAALGGARAAPLVVGLGRLEPRKGFDHLIRAVAAARETHPALALALAGDGADRPRLEAIAAETGAPAVFLGRISEAEKAALLAEATLFAMPSRAEGDSVEGFGLVYLEAGWHGAPALAGRVGGAVDAVIEGATGWLCDGARAEEVAAALLGALADPAELARRGALAAAHARDQLWSARIDAFREA